MRQFLSLRNSRKPLGNKTIRRASGSHGGTADDHLRNGASLANLLGRIDAVADGAPALDSIPTGFPSLDRTLGGGFRRGDLIALGGDVGSGKSALGLAMALRSAEADEARFVAFLSAEMTAARVLERALAIEGRVAIDALRGGALDQQARSRVGAVAVRLRDRLPTIERFSSAGVEGIADLLRHLGGAGRVQREEGVGGFVVVDSLQHLATGRAPRDEELAVAVNRLKVLALDLNLAILTTVQLAPNAARVDPRPQLDDFGALGAVKHHADVVLALFREEMYGGGREVAGATELFVRKNRNGATGYLDLYFYSQWMRFEDMLDSDR